MKTKRYHLTFVFVVLLMIAFSMPAFAQLEDAIEQLESDNTKGYLQPMTDALGANLNSGLHHTARVPFIGLNIYIGVAATGTIIPDDDLTYMALPPEPFPQEEIETATVFGDEGASFEHESGLSYKFPDGQVQGNFIPLAIPHLEVGSFFGTKAKVRYFASDLGEDVGELSLFGWGLQHSISRYIPLFPIDVSAHYFQQSLDVGDYLSIKTNSIGLLGSKKFALLTLYGGVSLDNTTMDVEYTCTDGEIEKNIALELESKGNTRIVIGGSLRLAFLTIHGDYYIGPQSTVTLGVGLGF